MFQKLYQRNFQNTFYLSLLPRSHYEKVRIANLHCHLLKSALRRTDIFRYSPLSRKEVALFINIDRQKKRKQKYTSLFIKDLQSTFLKATQALQ